MDTATRAYSYDSTHIMPLVDDVFNLGSAELGWKGLYMPDTYIKDDVGKVLLRNSADDAYVDLWSKDLYPQGNIIPIAGGVLKSGPTNGDTLLIAANDTTFFTFLTGATDTCTVNGDLTFASGKGINFDTYGIKITDTYIQFGNDTDTLGPKLIYGSATQVNVFQSNGITRGDLLCGTMNVENIQLSAALYSTADSWILRTRNADNAYVSLQARDNGVGSVEVGRLAGAADPYFQIGRDDTGVALSSVTDMLYLQAGSGTGNNAAGFGLGVPFLLGNGASEVEERASIDCVLVTATNGAEDARFDFNVMGAGSMVNQVMQIASDGVTFNQAATFNGNLIAGTLDIDDDSGAVTLVDMGVTDAPADGTEESYAFKLDGVSMFTIYGKSDGAGAVDERSLNCNAHLKLLITDTDGIAEGQIWYDASEDKLKFKTAAGVETISSA